MSKGKILHTLDEASSRVYRLHEEKTSLQKNNMLDDLWKKNELKTISCQMSAGFKTVHPYIYLLYILHLIFYV